MSQAAVVPLTQGHKLCGKCRIPFPDISSSPVCDPCRDQLSEDAKAVRNIWLYIEEVNFLRRRYRLISAALI